MDIQQLARKNVRELTPYLSARRIGGSGDTWVNANESPFSNEFTIKLDSLNRYSDCQPQRLIDAYANYAQIKSSQVVASRGSDEAIELFIRAFCEPGKDAILYCPPTYGMYGVSAETFGIARKTIPLIDKSTTSVRDWQLDLDKIKQNLENVKIIYVCSPNNPTGNLVNKQDILTLLEMTKDKAIVVIDEAYIDFCLDHSVKNLIDQYPNIAILRTLSKAFALAGLRCGFTLTNENIAQILLKVIAPYPVPIPVEEIACQALSAQGVARKERQVQCLLKNRALLTKEFNAMGLTVYPGYGNYLLVKFPFGDKVFKFCWDRGVILRNQPIEDCLRISIGTEAECQHVLETIRLALNA